MNDIFHQWLVNFGCFIFGLVAGATAMIYVYEQPKVSKPVVTVEQDGAFGRLAIKPAPESLKDSDAAPPLVEAEKARHLQRVKELRFSLEKLERMKAVQDAFLKQAVANRDSIRGMVAKLGEGAGQHE